MKLKSYACGEWFTSESDGVELKDASTGELVATCTSDGLDFGKMAKYAREVGGPALRKMSFHTRAILLKKMANALVEFKREFYDLSYQTGATKGDTWVDVDGGLGTLFVYSSKGRRELPDEPFYVDGDTEKLSKNGTFVGRHIMVPRQGFALHINAFNFPCWGMLEKIAPSLLAGLPSIVKPATATAQVTEAVVKRIIESKILPEGALQLICGRTGDLFDHMNCQDMVSFTGSANTALYLSSHKNIREKSIPFTAECDSLNASLLGPDAGPDTPEFELFLKEVVREMTVKAGQKCTAIRRIILPREFKDDFQSALLAKLEKTTIGDPRSEGVRMGPLADLSQRVEVIERVSELSQECEIVLDGREEFDPIGCDYKDGAFIKPSVLYCDKPLEANLVHSVEAFGPVSTILPYDTIADGIKLANMGGGSLVSSLFSYDKDVITKAVMGIGAYHGRLCIIDRDSAAESTGHGSPMPHMKHGGPGRAGGGEELGGIRSVKHYLQRVAIQGSPDVLTNVTNRWTTGSKENELDVHPFRKNFNEIQIGDTLTTGEREVTLADVSHFAEFTGDNFYAHTDENAAAANPFFEGKVAHGYLQLSFAAGLFVDPAPGPVLANYGLTDLNFVQPVYPGDVMKVRLVCKQKTVRKEAVFGEVRWDVTITNQGGDVCANYELLTLNERIGDD